ncbi:pyocin [Salmonella enterica]|nr:pyocin [Salmonella enterica]
MGYRTNNYGRGQALHGDKTTTGATVLTSLPNCTEFGRGVIRVGDKTTVCPKCGKSGHVLNGEPHVIFHGVASAVDGSLVSCGCPPGSNRIIAPAGQWLGQGKSPEQLAAEKRAAAAADAAAARKTQEDKEQAIRSMPVFAKSSQCGPGNTEALTCETSHRDFGAMAYYMATPEARINDAPATDQTVTQHAQTAKRKKPASTEDKGSWFSRVFGGGKGSANDSAPAAAAAAATVTRTPLQLALAEGSELALLRLLGGAASTVGTWLVETSPIGAGVVGALWSTKLNAGEQDFIDSMRLRQLAESRGEADTRVRFMWRDNGGRLEPVGFNVAQGSGLDKVPVRMLQKNWRTGAYEFVEDGEKRPTLVWTPDNPGFTLPSNTGNNDTPYLPSSVLVHPQDEIPRLGSTVSPGPEEKTFRDYILVHPEGAFEPIYIYLSKPPVKFLDVELYSDFERRSRQKLYEADHMPSAAAVKLALSRENPLLSPRELDRLSKDVAALIVPIAIHHNVSETFGGRNTPEQIERDSRDLRAALDRNFDAVKPELKKEGATEAQLEAARARMHKLNTEVGLYK